MSRKSTDKRMKLQNKIVEEVSKLDIKNKMNPAKTKLGSALQNRAIKNFERRKMNTLKTISKQQKNIVGKGFDTVRDVAAQILASETAKSFNSKNSYVNGLAAWTNNISGNPDPSKGEQGVTQTGSTSELGG